MIDKIEFYRFIESKVVSKKTTINIADLVKAFTTPDIPSYKLLNITSSSLSAKLKRLFGDNLENKPRSMSVEVFMLKEFGYKACGTCKSIKTLEDFYISSHTATGFQSECIVCVKDRNKRQYEKDSSKAKYNAAKRRAALLQAEPNWLSEEQKAQIMHFYTKGHQLGLEVDHIVPLQGEKICGLHVPWNLQLLDVSENRKKYNKTENEWNN